MKILVTGGCGYIGAHTVTDLLENGFDVISVDNQSRSIPNILKGVEKITGIRVKNYDTDLCDIAQTRSIFIENPDIEGVIHFAAYKSVNESVEKPLLYYRNNLNSLLNLLECIQEFKVPHLVFSSSCSVYGNVSQLPVTEDTPVPKAESPYANTKQMGEDIITHFSKAYEGNNVLLRYFNPVGAHTSTCIGEVQAKPQNLVPVITRAAAGKRKGLTVYGGDYDTRDGSCVRDYIHVMDIAHAHTLAFQYMQQGKNESRCEVFNLGLGEGVTVLEAIRAFEKVSGRKLDYHIGERRAGDVIKIYADNQKARTQLNWQPAYTIEDMMQTAWAWEQQQDEVMASYDMGETV